MKRLISIIAIISLFANLTACGNSAGDADNSKAFDDDGRTELILATDASSSDIAYIVNSFNQSSKDYTIKVSYYGTREKNMDHLRTEIIAGNTPDIYAFTQSQLADVQIPIYEDLLPYLDNDPSYNRETFVSSLFQAITKGGSLDYIPYDFYVETFTARESVVGKRSGLTMEEAEGFAKDMGPDVNIFPAWLPRQALLAHIVTFSAAKFIDRAAGTCDFLDPEFIELLEQCKA
ncbi:MAG: hypothetical protein GX025_07995, partial [Clostridiales bacterium]|nr:hypothetical protein [Clostridiales bacterium]